MELWIIIGIIVFIVWISTDNNAKKNKTNQKIDWSDYVLDNTYEMKFQVFNWVHGNPFEVWLPCHITHKGTPTIDFLCRNNSSNYNCYAFLIDSNFAMIAGVYDRPDDRYDPQSDIRVLAFKYKHEKEEKIFSIDNNSEYVCIPFTFDKDVDCVEIMKKSQLDCYNKTP